MRKLKFPRTPKAGLPPGSLVHVGEPQTAQVKTRQLIYDTRGSEESKAISWAHLESPGKPDGVTWINMDGVHEAEPMARMGKHFHLHPLTLEDIMNTAQRPKTEDYDDYIFIVLKKFSIEEDTGLIKSEQVSIVLGSQLLLSFQEVDDDIFDGVRERIRKGKGRIRDSGADYLAYALVDAIVDQYFAILETLGNRLETLDEEILTDPTSRTLQAIHNLKGELIQLRKQIWPTREVLNHLTHVESPLIDNATTLFLRDVYDHTIQVMDAIESYRDILSGMLDIYLSMVNHRTNEIMRVLTMMATIFIPLTFIVGVYGMNFRYMPELGWQWGYPIILFVMFLIVFMMLIFFKRKKWL